MEDFRPTHWKSHVGSVNARTSLDIFAVFNGLEGEGGSAVHAARSTLAGDTEPARPRPPEVEQAASSNFNTESANPKFTIGQAIRYRPIRGSINARATNADMFAHLRVENQWMAAPPQPLIGNSKRGVGPPADTFSFGEPKLEARSLVRRPTTAVSADRRIQEYIDTESRKRSECITCIVPKCTPAP